MEHTQTHGYEENFFLFLILIDQSLDDIGRQSIRNFFPLLFNRIVARINRGKSFSSKYVRRFPTWSPIICLLSMTKKRKLRNE